MDNNKYILTKIANTIMANIENTDKIGLSDGKMGICLFFYEYSHISGIDYYSKIASDLLDDILKSLNFKITPSVLNGVASIGCGLIDLSKDEFIETEEDILCDIDNIVFNNIEKTLLNECNSETAVFTSGIYITHRISFCRETIKEEWISSVIDTIFGFIFNCFKSRMKPKLSLLNSMLFVCATLIKDENIKYKQKIQSSINLLKSLINISIQNHKYNISDIIILKEFLSSKEYNHLPTLNYKNEIDCWFESNWFYYLYNIFPKNNIEEKEITPFLECKVIDTFYDLSIINSKLAAAGLYIINHLSRKI